MVRVNKFFFVNYEILKPNENIKLNCLFSIIIDLILTVMWGLDD